MNIKKENYTISKIEHTFDDDEEIIKFELTTKNGSGVFKEKVKSSGYRDYLFVNYIGGYIIKRQQEEFDTIVDNISNNQNEYLNVYADLTDYLNQ